MGGSIDWAATGAMLSGIGNFVAAGAVILAALIGRSTFTQWRRQKSEERRIDLAEQVLTAAYKCRRRFEFARNSIEFDYDQEEAEEKLKESNTLSQSHNEGRKKRMISAQIVLTRMFDGDDWDRLAEFEPVAKAVFGEGVTDQIDKMFQQRGATAVAARRYGHTDDPPDYLDDEMREKFWNRHQEVEDRMWGMSKDDKIGAAFDAAVKALEEQLLPIIRGEDSSGTGKGWRLPFLRRAQTKALDGK